MGSAFLFVCHYCSSQVLGSRDFGAGSRESGAVRPVANLITGQAHRGSRE
ncbi:hypothetical protein BJP36_42285 [Moorena producens JHB]|uniref:Uncharacterized protein n=1 Tax=Moorena producens (strain JHB) TaxID=1454205 RepID=A0A9Q9SSS0_MOOP1|nr:hypothetical protein [Moorena producens]WAN68994.1 hypothetical protein BJP36_42285 [Moorena producens JHB]